MKTTKNITNLVGRTINYRTYVARDSDGFFVPCEDYDCEVIEQKDATLYMKNGDNLVMTAETVNELANSGLYRRTFNGGDTLLELRLN